jgi:hypothetical protein
MKMKKKVKIIFLYDTMPLKAVRYAARRNESQGKEKNAIKAKTRIKPERKPLGFSPYISRLLSLGTACR